MLTAAFEEGLEESGTSYSIQKPQYPKYPKVTLFKLYHALSFGKKKYGQEMLGRFPVLHFDNQIVFLTAPVHQIKLDLPLKNQSNTQKICSISDLLVGCCGTEQTDWVLRKKYSMYSGEGRSTGESHGKTMSCST